MNIMQKLTLRQMLMNKRRTIVTIIGIMFSVALITAVSTFMGSFRDVFRQATIVEKGNWQVQYLDVSKEDVGKIAEDGNTKTYAALYERGIVKLDSETATYPFVMNQQMNPEGFAQQNVTLLEGRMPQTPSEVVISKTLAEDFPDQFSVGKTVSWEFGKRIANQTEGEESQTEERTLGWMSSYLGENGETFVPTGTEEMTIVGIVDAPIYEPSYSASYATFSALDLNALPQNAHLEVLVGVKDLDKSIYSRSESLLETLSSTAGMSYNTQLLLYSGVSNNDVVLTTLGLIVGIVILIVVISSIALIYNSFAISISERSVNFGMLSGFGATARQKRHSVLFEALILSGIGIPLGLGLGFAGMGVTLAIVNPMFKNFLNIADSQQVTLHLVVSPIALIAAVVISLLMIFLSAWIPARRASRITPIDAIRKSKDVKLTSKEIKTPKIVRKIFGFEAEMALKNLKRNKKRYRITIVSLVLSLVLFLSASSFGHYMTYTYDITLSTINYDINANISLTKDNYEQEKQVGQKILDEMKQVSGIQEQTSYFFKDLTMEVDSSMVAPIIQDYWNQQGKHNLDTLSFNVSFLGMDAESLKAYAKQVGADYDALTDPSNPQAILINQMDYIKRSQAAKLSFLTKKPGETVSLYNSMREGNKAADGETPKKDLVDITLASLTDQVPMGVNSMTTSPTDVVMIVSQEVFDEILRKIPDIPDTLTGQTEDDRIARSSLNAQFYATSDDDKAVSKKLEKVLDSYRKQTGVGGSVYNISSETESVDQMLLMMNIFVYGFITLISLIGIANIFNTISTGLALRRRESAMLKSIGMSPKSFRKMINFESLFYGMKTVLYGLPIGFGVMGLIYWTLQRNFTMPFTVPWLHLACGVAGIFLVVVLTMLYSSSKLKKENVIDILRNENV